MADNDALSEQYRRRFESKRDYRDGVWKALLRRRLQSLVGQDKIVLDLGCGWGEFIRNVEAKEKYAMDLNPDAATLIGNETQFLRQDCSDRWSLENDSLDVVFSSNFLEHLPDKDAIDATLVQAQRCLRPGGRLILLGPNIRYVGGAYWDYWDHHVPLTENSLVEILVLRGYDVVQTLPRFLPYTMSGGNEPPLFLVNVYLAMPLFWPLLGKQFLIVAETK